MPGRPTRSNLAAMGAVELTVSQKLFSAFIDGGEAGDWSRTRFLGVRLRKHSLWHRMMLRSVDSPFIKRGVVTMRDLRITAGICRCEYGNSNIRKPWLKPFLIYVRAIMAAILLRPKAKAALEGLNPYQRALTAQAETLAEYFGDYLAEPEYAVRRSDSAAGRDPQTPRGTFNEEFEHVSELVQFFHGAVTLAQIWDMPISAANYWRVVARRASGMDIDVVTDKEGEFTKNLPPEYRHK